MKSTVIIFALAIVILAVIVNHGCESATAAIPRKMAAEDRANGEFCTTLQGKCNDLSGRPVLNRICTAAYNLFKRLNICS